MVSIQELRFVNTAIEKGYLGKGTVSYALIYKQKCAMQGKTISITQYFLESNILTQKQIEEIQEQALKSQKNYSLAEIIEKLGLSEYCEDTSILDPKKQDVADGFAEVPAMGMDTTGMATSGTRMPDSDISAMMASGTRSSTGTFAVDSLEDITGEATALMMEEKELSSAVTAVIEPGSFNQPSPGGRLKKNDMFAHYRVEEELGHGGMGSVYKVYDTKLERTVALKLIAASQRISDRKIKRFLQEAKATARLEHPNIVKVFEVGDSPENYFTMEYLEGPTLTELIQKQQIKPVYAATIAQKIADALHCAHKNNIIHRDIKPSNIMLDGKKEPKLMDFGLSKVTDSENSLSKTGEALGTPAYMSPEQAANKQDIDHKSDVYSLGATLYEMLSGKPLFHGNSYFDILNQVFHAIPTPLRAINGDIPKDLEAICLKSIEKKPEKRYQTARSFAKDLKNFIERKAVLARPRSKLLKTKKFFFKYRFAIFAVLFFIILSASNFAVYKYSRFQEKKHLQQTHQNYALLVNLLTENETLNSVHFSNHSDLQKILQELLKQPELTKNDTEILAKFHKLVEESSKKPLKNSITPFEAYFYRGNYYASQQKWQEAYNDYSNAIAIHKNDARLYFSRGKVALYLEKFEEALQDFIQTTELKPDHAEAYHEMGLLNYKRDQKEEARKNFERSIFFSPKNSQFIYTLGMYYYELQNSEKALEFFKKVNVEEIDTKKAADVYFNIGVCNSEMQNYKESLRNFTKSIVLCESANAYYRRGLIHDKLQQYDQAVQDWRQAILHNFPDRELINKLIRQRRGH